MNNLIRWADEALQEQSGRPAPGCSKVLDGSTINESYNSSVAALGVSVAMGELMPALAIYYQDKPGSDSKPKANRRSVLDVIARIITKDTDLNLDFSGAGKFPDNLFRYAMDHVNDVKFKKEVIDCSIALKHVVRTYKLV